jgi:hypothetical protein
MIMSDKGVIDIKKKGRLKCLQLWFYNRLKNSGSVEKLSTPDALTGGSSLHILYPILVPGIISVFRKPATKAVHCLPSAGHGLSPSLFVFTSRFPHTTNLRFTPPPPHRFNTRLFQGNHSDFVSAARLVYR